MRRLRRDDYDWIEQHPEPADTPVARLAHVLDVFDDTPGDKFVVEATRNLYDDGKVTGLTYGDLRDLKADLDHFRDFARWLVVMDEPGNIDRRTITLSRIIETARAVLGEDVEMASEAQRLDGKGA